MKMTMQCLVCNHFNRELPDGDNCECRCHHGEDVFPRKWTNPPRSVIRTVDYEKGARRRAGVVGRKASKAFRNGYC